MLTTHVQSLVELAEKSGDDSVPLAIIPNPTKEEMVEINEVAKKLKVSEDVVK